MKSTKNLLLLITTVFICCFSDIDAQSIVHHLYAQNPSFDSVVGNEPSVRNRGGYELVGPFAVAAVSDSGGMTTIVVRVADSWATMTEPTGNADFCSLDPTWIGGYFQIYRTWSAGDTLSPQVYYQCGDKYVYISLPSSVIDTASPSLFWLAHLDSALPPLSIPSDVGQFGFIRLITSQKLLTPVINSVSVNGNAELVLDATLDPRSHQYILMIREYEQDLIGRKFSAVCGIDSADNYTFSDPTDLNVSLQPGSYLVTVLSLSDSVGRENSNVAVPHLLTVPASVFAPIEQPTIVGATVANDSIYVDVEFDSRFTSDGKCKISVITDDGGSYITDPSLVQLFFGQLPVLCKVFDVNTVVSDSVARFALGSFDPGTNYVVSARCSDPNVLHGAHSPDAALYNVATTLNTVIMHGPDSCQIVSAMELVVDGNVHSSLQITLEELVGVNNWSQIFQTTFTDASPEWSSRDGNVTLSFTGYNNNSYRWKISTGNFIEFALNEVSVHSTCASIQLDAHEMYPQAVAPTQNVRFRASVLGDTSGSQIIVAEIENLTTGSPATLHYLSHIAGGLYELNTSFPDTGLYQVRFQDTISNTYSETVVFVVRDVCVGQSVVFDSVSHIYPNLLGICDTTVNAPFLGLVTDIAGACPERCDTTGLDPFCSGDGNYVTLRSITNPNYYFRFTNLNEVNVAEGDLLRPGELLGVTGNTGDVSATHMQMLKDSAGQMISQAFVMDAQCPETEALLAVDQALLLDATPGNIAAAATVVNWSQGFFYGVVEIIVYSSGLQKSAGSQVIGSQAVFLEAGESVQLQFTNTFSLTGDQIAVIRYKAQWEDNWSMVSAQDAGRRNAVGIDMSRILTTSVLNDGVLDVKVYPNPVGDVLNIQTEAQDVQIEVFDIMGHAVMTAYAVNQINTTQLAQGVYILKLTSETQRQSSVIRLVKR